MSKPDSEGQWLFDNYVVLVELEKRRIGFDF
jgi:hypothetical protein